MQFATNHLGYFALVLGLHDALVAAGNVRLVTVSSAGHLLSPIVFEDIHFEHREYNPWSAYGQSKTANVVFAVEATKRWAQDGITANALMPGGIRTNLQRHQHSPEYQKIADAYPWKTLEEGTSTLVLVAPSPLLEGISGRYFEDNNEALPGPPFAESGVATYALDPNAATQLWEVSAELLANRSKTKR